MGLPAVWQCGMGRFLLVVAAVCGACFHFDPAWTCVWVNKSVVQGVFTACVLQRGRRLWDVCGCTTQCVQQTPSRCLEVVAPCKLCGTQGRADPGWSLCMLWVGFVLKAGGQHFFGQELPRGDSPGKEPWVQSPLHLTSVCVCVSVPLPFNGLCTAHQQHSSSSLRCPHLTTCAVAPRVSMFLVLGSPAVVGHSVSAGC